MKFYVVKNKITGEWAGSMGTRKRIRRGVYTPTKTVAYHLFSRLNAATEHKRHLNRSQPRQWFVQGVNL